MGQVLIRDLGDDVIAAFRESAARNVRSLEAELRDFLSTRRPKTQAEIAGFVERAAAIRAMTPDVPQTPSAELIREMRDSRLER